MGSNDMPRSSLKCCFQGLGCLGGEALFNGLARYRNPEGASRLGELVVTRLWIRQPAENQRLDERTPGEFPVPLNQTTLASGFICGMG